MSDIVGRITDLGNECHCLSNDKWNDLRRRVESISEIAKQEKLLHEGTKGELVGCEERLSEYMLWYQQSEEDNTILNDQLTVAKEALRHVIMAAERCSCSGYAIKETGGVGYQISEDIQQIAREALEKLG